MATDADVESIKLMVGSQYFTDDQFKTLLDKHNINFIATAAEVWEIRAGKYHTMVDVTESGSSRKLGALYGNALGMAAYYRNQLVDVVVDIGDLERPSRTGRIIRT